MRIIGRTLAAVAVVLTLAACGGDGSDGSASPLTDAEASPSDIIDAWAAAACDGSIVKQNNVEDDPQDVFSEDVVASASCPINETSSETNVYIEVYGSVNAVKTKLASVKCGNGYRKVTGPNWYSSMTSQSSATALQDAGGTLAC